MANEVRNIVVFSTEDSFAEIDEMLNQIRGTKAADLIDFDVIIPMPDDLNIECSSNMEDGLTAYKNFVSETYPSLSLEDDKGILWLITAKTENLYRRQHREISRDTWALGRKAFQNILKYDAPSWYEWRIQNWGTKWNAQDCFSDYPGHIGFATPNTAPHPIIKKLSELHPNVNINHWWADEDRGINCGHRGYIGGKCIDDYLPEGQTAHDFACRVWGEDPEQDKGDPER